jgi:hypothetical protein
MEEWRYRSTIYNLTTRWMLVAIFTPRPLYSQEKNPRCSLHRRSRGPKASLDDAENIKITFPYQESNADFSVIQVEAATIFSK